MGVKILVADDSPEVRAAMVTYLQEAPNCEVRDAAHVDQAITILKEGFVPDIIFTDFDFGPGYANGYALGEQVRALGYTMPIVLISGADSDITARDGAARGIGNGGVYITFQKGHHSLATIVRRLKHDDLLPADFDV